MMDRNIYEGTRNMRIYLTQEIVFMYRLGDKKML